MTNNIFNSPLFPLEELSPETFVKLPKSPDAESRSVKLYIILAEPQLFLEGFTKDEVLSRPPAILRGCLFLRVLHPVKIKSINLKLKGTSRTEWPEGIPPKKVEHSETKGLINHTWPFFNYQNSYPVTESSRNNADLFIPKSDYDVTNFSLDNNNFTISPVTSNQDILKPVLSPVLSPVSLLKSFRSTSNSDLTSTLSNSNANSNDDNKSFLPGDYIYSFELPLQSSLPETVSVTFGFISYNLEAHVERSGTFKTDLTARKPLILVRAPFESSSEENEPIIIDREWEDKLQYDIVIYSKQVVLNSYLPISFRMIPLEKIKIHRLRVYMTEHLEYYCHNKKVHRTEPPKKILLLEHKPPEGCDNLLSLSDDEIGGIELDFQVFVPEYYNERFHLHPDTTSEDIQSHHWIKLCIRISRADPTPEDPNKRKQYELSIDSPMHLLSKHCVHANTLLPSYDDQLKLDYTNENNINYMTDTGSVKTLTPLMNTNPKQSLDKMLSPRDDTILESNLFQPDKSVPVELLSPQAKPFSPIASPQLNAIKPELREGKSIIPFDLSPLSPILSPNKSHARSQSRSHSTTKGSSLKNRALSPVARSIPVARALSSNEEPPPPFVEHPPSYAEATKSATVASDKMDPADSASSSNSAISNMSRISDHSITGTTPLQQLSESLSSLALNSAQNNSVKSTTTYSRHNPPNRISLNLGTPHGSNTHLQRMGIQMSSRNMSGTGTMAPTTPNESTPSIASFLGSPITHPSNQQQEQTEMHPSFSVKSLNSMQSTVSQTTRGRSKEPKLVANQASSVDLAEDSDFKFKITPIRSSSGSPFLHSQQPPSRSLSPRRAGSPIPIIAQDRNMNRLVKSVYMPGFSLNEELETPIDELSHDENEPLNINDIIVQNPTINITGSRSPSTSLLSASEPMDDVQRSRPSVELSLNMPLLKQSETNHSNESSVTNDEPNSSGLGENYRLHSNTLGSLNSLDMVLENNRSQATINTFGSENVDGYFNARNGSVVSHNTRAVALNYLGNNMDGLGIDDGTDITSMGKFERCDSKTLVSSGKLRNPKLAHSSGK